MMRASEAHRRGLNPRLRLRGAAVSGIEPEIMGFAPAIGIPALLRKCDVSLDEIDAIELNEAFAAQSIAVIRELALDEDRVNVHGGAIALGHPLGATGAILVVKLMNALRLLDGRLGTVSLCIGGGQAL